MGVPGPGRRGRRAFAGPFVYLIVRNVEGGGGLGPGPRRPDARAAVAHADPRREHRDRGGGARHRGGLAGGPHRPARPARLGRAAGPAPGHPLVHRGLRADRRLLARRPARAPDRPARAGVGERLLGRLRRAHAADLPLRVPAGGRPPAGPAALDGGVRPPARARRARHLPHGRAPPGLDRGAGRDAAGLPLHDQRVRPGAAAALRHPDPGDLRQPGARPAGLDHDEPDAGRPGDRDRGGRARSRSAPAGPAATRGARPGGPAGALAGRGARPGRRGGGPGPDRAGRGAVLLGAARAGRGRVAVGSAGGEPGQAGRARDQHLRREPARGRLRGGRRAAGGLLHDARARAAAAASRTPWWWAGSPCPAL